MNVRWFLLTLSVTFPAPLLAQSPKVLGRDDAEFARRLFDHGYTDLAEKLVALIEKSGKVDPKDEANIKVLHLSVRLDLAQKEPDPYKRKDLLKQILAEKEEIVKQYTGSTAADDTANSLPDTYSMLGACVLACIAKEKDLNLIAQLQQEGQKIFSTSEESLKKRIEDLTEKKDDPAFKNAYVGALFNLPKTYYFHSLLYPESQSSDKERRLNLAITAFQEFGLDYNELLLNYEGFIYSGLCYRELGNKEEALRSFDSAIAVRQEFEQAKGVYMVGQEWGDMISKAVLQKVNLLVTMGNQKAAVDAGKDFFATILAPYETANGLQLLAALGYAQFAIGDTKGCDETADKLIAEDGNGPWGAVGFDLKGKIAGAGGGSDAASLMKIANSFFSRGQGEKALPFARQAIAASKGSKDGSAIAVDAWLLIGSIYAQRGWNQEAALAFDTCADRYSSAEKAPEAVYQALMQYVTLSSLEKKPLYKTRVEERRKTLTTKYPTHDRAAVAQLVDGDTLVGEGKYLEAVESYTKIQPTSPAYYDAQLKIGSCYYQFARKLDKDGKKSEAAQYYTQAETILKKSATDFDKLREETVNLEKQGRYENSGFYARLMLADLYLSTAKAALVLPLLEGAESRYANDADKLSQVWGLRIRALKEQNKLEDAIKLLDALVKKDPKSKAVGAGAGLIARELDKQAGEAHDAKKQQDADKLYRRAADYYALSGRALLTGDSIKPADVIAIARRLFVLGLSFNGVPEGQDTFIGYDVKTVRDPKLWELAAELYQAGLKISPSTEAQLNLARIQAFLGRWKEAADAYADYFNSAGTIFDADGKLARSVSSDQRLAYIEMGVCEEQFAVANNNDRERFARAEDIFVKMDKAMPADSELWWYARYYLIKERYDRGAYKEAAASLRETERGTNVLGGTTGLVPAFTKLKSEVDKKAPK